MVRRAWRVLFVLPALGCGGPSAPEPASPVTVEGNPADVRALAGLWRGEYLNQRDQRSGEIVFNLPREGATGYSSITFTAPAPPTVCPELTQTPPPAAKPVQTVLRIGRLVVDRGSVSGWLVPYRDERHDCWVDTWFEGRLVRDRLEGTFYSHLTATDTIRMGSWWATRAQ